LSKFSLLSSKNGSGSSDLRRTFQVGRVALAWNIFVVLFGAVVRISGSGAGCGQHWPTCNGEIAHLPRRLETWVELTHRVTSGAAFLLVVAFTWLSFRGAPAGHRVRGAASAAMFLMVLEALIGAVLVLFGLVAKDASQSRAVVMPAHLLVTFGLVAALTLAVRWSAAESEARIEPHDDVGDSSPSAPWLALGALAIVVVALSGALTALGDTLFPPTASSLAGRLQEDQGAGAHFLQRLRVFHPVLAVGAAALVVYVAAAFVGSERASARRSSRAVLAFVGLQLAAGGLNVALSAPGWLQVVHLGLALGLWIAFVSLAGEVGVTARSVAHRRLLAGDP
jgi:heme A synthase